MEQQLVSIILPVYHPDLRFLKEVLISVGKQTYSNFELIISDDSDETSSALLSLLKQFESEYPIRFFKNKRHKGIFSNINNGIQQAHGSFIQLFSQDDVMLPHLLQDQVIILTTHKNAGMVFCKYDEINDQSLPLKSSVKKVFDPKADLSIPPQQSVSYFLQYGCMPGNISPVMLRRDVMDEIKEFNEELKYAGDYEYWVRLSARHEMYYRNLTGVLVRHHELRASNTISEGQLLLDLQVVYGLLISHVEEKDKLTTIRRINHSVGGRFLHHAVRSVLLLQWPPSALIRRIKDLNVFPFNASQSILGYTLSLPERLFRLIRLQSNVFARK